MRKTVLLLGASGKIGRHFGAAFKAAGWQVTRFTRGTNMTQAATGAQVIVNGLNPPAYHDWDNILPAITHDVLTAAKATGATVIFPGNVYVFGNQPGPWDETTPHKASSRKGNLRITAEAAYRQAAEEGVQTIILRGGDFLTPEPSDGAFDTLYFRGLKKGRLTSPGNMDAKRAHLWVPDMARIAVALAEKRSELPNFVDVPLPGFTFSSRELAREVEKQLRKPVKLVGFPWWMITLTSPVWELARELREMRYLFDHPHALKGERLAHLLPQFSPTPFEDALAEALKQRGFT